MENDNLEKLLNEVDPKVESEEKKDDRPDFGAFGENEYNDDILKGLGITVDEEGKAESEEKTQDELDMAENDNSLNKAKEAKGVDISLELDKDKIVGALVIEKEDFLKAFGLAIPVIQTTASDVAYKGLNLITDVENKTVKILSLNGIETLEYKCNKIETEYPMLNEKISLESSLLQKLVRVIGNHILIYRELVERDVVNEEGENVKVKEPGNLFIRLIDGDLVVEYKKVSEESLKVEGKKGELLKQVEANKLNDVLKTLIPISADGFKSEERNISFFNDRAYYKSSKYVVKYGIDAPEFVAKSLEAEFLRRLCTLFRGKVINFYSVEDVIARRIGIEVDNVYYTMLTAKPTVMEREESLLKDADSKVYIDADYTALLRIISLAADLPRSTGAVILKAKENELIIEIESKSGNSEFKCPAKIPEGLVNNLQVRSLAKPLKKLLSSITTERINIAIESDIFIKDGDFVAIFMNVM